jgi:Cft2 family RNA processing exonuclease
MTRSDWLLPFLEARSNGLYAPAFDAFIDPPSASPRAILSHAHADHAAAGHGEIWGTAETIAFYRRRHPDWPGQARVLAFGDQAEERGVLLEAFPSGHILGSAQLRFSNASSSLLYTGDFKRRTGRTPLPAQTPQARVLLTESTFGLPVFRFPPRAEVEVRLTAACRESLAAGQTPVVLAYALGKAQEAALVLGEAGIPQVLHGAAWKLLPEYASAGFAFPLARPYESGPAVLGEALIVPPRCARTPIVQNVKRRRVIYLSGWAVRSAARAHFDADVLLPLSDHADFQELLDHVAEVGAERVVAHHGYAEDFARILEGRGRRAQALASAVERGAEDA